MSIEVGEESFDSLAEYAAIPMTVMVDRVLDVALVDGGLGGMQLTERRLDVPYIKDYDAVEGEGPTRWAKRFDMSNWGLITARRQRAMVGGAVIAFNTEGVDMLEGRSDLAVVWDIRVREDERGRGIGSSVFRAAEEWGHARGCRHLKVETQNINVPACRFYARMGCTLAAIDRLAYPDLPEETQLLWYKNP